jgi:hypothetical protein
VSDAPHVHTSDADRSLFDRLGIGVSMTCAVHCVISSLVALAPAMGLGGSGFAGPSVGAAMEWLELPLLLGALCIGLWALVPAYVRDHKKPLAIRLFVVGIGLIFASRLVGPQALETALTVMGVVFVASAHVTNLRAHAAHHRSHAGHAH